MEYISIASGSSGNCHFIQKNNTAVLVDAGLTGKSTIEALNSHDIDISKIRGIFITHEHTDHIKGAGIISRKFDIPVYATEPTWDNMKNKLGNISDKNIKIIRNSDSISVDDLQISTVPIKHDAVDPVAYNITDTKETISIVTDLGIVTQKVFNFMAKSKVVVLESNHDINMLDAGPYSYELKRRVKSNFGHLSNDSAGDVCVDLVKSGAKKILLAHLSRQNNIPLLAYQSVVSILLEKGIKANIDVDVSVLEPFSPSAKIAI